MSGFVVRFLTRQECRLCDRARPLVVSAVGRLGGEMVELDVDSYPDLVRHFGNRVPVVLGPGDSVVAEGSIDDERALRRSLKRLKRA